MVRVIAALVVIVAGHTFPAIAKTRHAGGKKRSAVATTQESAVLKTVIAARWQFAAARPSLPPVQLVHKEALEIQDFIEYAFDGGALWLYVSPGPAGGDIFALLVNTRGPRYASFRQLVSTEHYTTYHDGPYAVVLPLRPVSKQVFDKLKAKQRTADELQQQLGAPSYSWHIHGVGLLGLTYVPQGLSFIGEPTAPVAYQLHAAAAEEEWNKRQDADGGLPPFQSLAHLDYLGLQSECRDAFAKELVSQREQFDQALAHGKRSPDGRFVVGMANIEGLGYSGELVIQETGKPERRYTGAWFTHDKDYLWLNSRVIVFKTYGAEGEDFYTIDAVTGTRKLAAHVPHEMERSPSRHATQFGISGPQRFWYKTADGEMHEVNVESLKPRAER